MVQEHRLRSLDNTLIVIVIKRVVKLVVGALHCEAAMFLPILLY